MRLYREWDWHKEWLAKELFYYAVLKVKRDEICIYYANKDNMFIVFENEPRIFGNKLLENFLKKIKEVKAKDETQKKEKYL